jgi:subfamily B ATP-binding cassette protein MsbA
MLTTNITSLLSQVLTLVGSIIIVLTMNTRFTLFILALVPLLILVAFFFGSRIESSTASRPTGRLTVVAEEGHRDRR